MTTKRLRATYKLEDLWQALAEQRYLFGRPAREGFTALGWTEEDALDCLRGLSKGDFRKSEIGREIKGWHDFYRAEWNSEYVYLHFCQLESGMFLIASFKHDTDHDG